MTPTTTTTDPTLEVNPKDALPTGAPVDRVVLRYSQPAHRAFFSSVMQRLQQPEVSPRQLLEALSVAVVEMEAEEARKAEEEARRVEEEKKRLEEEKKREEDEARKAEEDKRIEEARKKEEEARRVVEEARRAEEVKAKADEEARRLYEESKRAEEVKRMDEEKRRMEEAGKPYFNLTGKALEEARRAYEEAKKAQDEARRAEDEAKKAAELSARSCGVCHTPSPAARAVFATCGHVACLKCAESAAARGAGRLECPYCAAPTTYMRLFEREMITKTVESSPKSASRCVRFCDKNEVKEFDKDEEEATVSAETTVAEVPRGSIMCGLFGRKQQQ